MTTTISGDTGVSKTAAASVNQAALTAGVAGTGPAFIARKTSNQTVSANTNTKVTMGAEDYDTDACFDLANSKFTPNVAGFYQVNGIVYMTIASSAAYAFIFKNGSMELYGSGAPQGVSGVSGLVYMNGTTDYLELYCYGNGTIVNAGVGLTHFSAHLARKA